MQNNQSLNKATSIPTATTRPVIKGWEDVPIYTICIKTKFPQIFGSPADEIAYILDRMGYKVLTNESNCDLILNADLEVVAISHLYSGAGGGFNERNTENTSNSLSN